MKVTADVLLHSEDRKERAYAAFAGSVAKVLLHIEDWEAPLIFEYLTDLPKGLRLWGCYFIAYDAYQKGEYERSRGIVETGLAFKPAVISGFVYISSPCGSDGRCQYEENERSRRAFSGSMGTGRAGWTAGRNR